MPLSKETNKPACGICLEPQSSQHAILEPCNQQYDLECIAHYLLSSFDLGARKSCPYCHSTVVSVSYTSPTSTSASSSGSKKYETFIFGTESNPPLLSSPFIPKNQELTPSMPPVLRSQILELRRLRRRAFPSPAISGFEGQHFRHARTKQLMSARMIDGDEYFRTTWSVRMIVTQAFEKTRSELVWIYAIVQIPKDSEVATVSLLERSPEIDQKARMYVRLTLERIARMIGKDIGLAWNNAQSDTEFEDGCPAKTVSDDGRGITASATNFLTGRRELVGNGGNLKTVVKRTVLEECFDPHSQMERGTDNAKQKENEKAIALARAEIQVARKIHFQGYEPVDEESGELDRASTGILEQVTIMECEQCDGKHQNGSCMMLPDDKPYY